jgi:hypothetical protein
VTHDEQKNECRIPNDDYGWLKGIIAMRPYFVIRSQIKGGNHERMEIFSTDFDNSNNDFGT